MNSVVGLQQKRLKSILTSFASIPNRIQTECVKLSKSMRCARKRQDKMNRVAKRLARNIFSFEKYGGGRRALCGRFHGENVSMPVNECRLILISHLWMRCPSLRGESREVAVTSEPARVSRPGFQCKFNVGQEMVNMTLLLPPIEEKSPPQLDGGLPDAPPKTAKARSTL